MEFDNGFDDEMDIGIDNETVTPDVNISCDVYQLIEHYTLKNSDIVDRHYGKSLSTEVRAKIISTLTVASVNAHIGFVRRRDKMRGTF